MRAVGKYIVCKDATVEEKTSIGLSFTGLALKEMRYQRGKVTAIGGDVTEVKVDDIIYFDNGGTSKMTLGGEEITIVKERDVVIIV